MVGLREAKAKFGELLAVAAYNALRKEHGEKPSKDAMHLVLEGPPGTGKSTFAEGIAEAYYGMGLVDDPEVMTVSGRDFVSDILGQTASKVTKMFDDAEGKVIVVDEAYGMVNSPQDEYGIEALNQFVKLSEERRHNTVVVLAGYKDELETLFSYNPGMKSRFPAAGRIPFKAYGDKDMADVAVSMAKDDGLVMSKKVEDRIRSYAPSLTDNARGARSFREAMRVSIAERLMASGKKHPRKDLSRLTVADVDNAMIKTQED